MTKEEIIQGLYRGDSRVIEEAIKELEKETVSKEAYDNEYFAREHAEYELWKIKEQEVCEDSINRQAIIDAIDSISKHHGGLLDVKLIAEGMPSTTPTRKVGKWIDCGFVDKSFREYKCSNCGESVYEKEYQIKHHKYCLHCGSRNEVE